MSAEPLYSPQSRAERLIASGRVVLAVSSLFAIWLDPSEPAKYAEIAYSLLVAYVSYSIAIALVVWRSDAPPNRQRLITHCFDLVFFSAFIYFTAGPASPFTAYFVFSLVCGTLRWQWRGTLWTALASLASFVGLSVYFMEGVADPAFQLYPLIVRGVYLSVVAVLLGYLGAHEDRSRRDMARLAAWPHAEPQRLEALVQSLLGHAARSVGVPRALLAWSEGEEPWVYFADLDEGSFAWSRSPPGEAGRLVGDSFEGAGFLCPDAADERRTVLRKRAGRLERIREMPLDPAFRKRFDLRAVLSLPLFGESIEGRLFLAGRRAMTSDDLVLGEIVAGVMAARLDRFYLNQRLREAVATEERIRLARDLHDGVLQSLTGIGLRLAAVRGLLDESPEAARDSLEALQGLIAREQRDLRFFIQELKPPPLDVAGEAPSLAASVGELLRRIEAEWGLRAELETRGLEGPIPEGLGREIYQMVREALVNAVRHGEATVVRILIERGPGGGLALQVSDDGRGFPFEGRCSHAELAARHLGPRTLLERVGALGGSLEIQSSAAGARLLIAIPGAEGGF